MTASFSPFLVFLYRWSKVTIALLSVAAVLLVCIPRHYFLGDKMSACVALILTGWPKMRVDAAHLSLVNEQFSDKYVVSMFMIVVLSGIIFIIGATRLVYIAIKFGAVGANPEVGGAARKNLPYAVLILVAGLGFVLFFSTPFREGPCCSYKVPPSELGIMFWSVFLISLSIVAEAVLALTLMIMRVGRNDE